MGRTRYSHQQIMDHRETCVSCGRTGATRRVQDATGVWVPTHSTPAIINNFGAYIERPNPCLERARTTDHWRLGAGLGL